MFVSILQLMGFSSPKPVHSRADGKPLSDMAPAASKTGVVKKAGAVAPVQTVQVKPARRSPVKAQAVKTVATTQAVAQTPKPVKAGKPVSADKAAPKATAKTLVKVTPKTDITPGKKPAAKPVPAREPVATAASKPVLSQTKKKPEKVTTPSPIASKVVETPAAAKPMAKSTGPELQMTPSGVPVRTGRPSSRLAQLTVPSMAQSVASTAAKSSFTQIPTAQPIVPPLASATKRDPQLADNWKTKPVATLTDAEIIAMSDDEYMNDTQLAYFRLKLVSLKTDILSNAGETTEHLREDTVVVPDPADRATIEEEHALELRTRDRERKLLKKIEQSIGRIDAGDYGYCDETGEPIGVGRLLARPTATLSLEAQQRRELKQKMFGD